MERDPAGIMGRRNIYRVHKSQLSISKHDISPHKLHVTGTCIKISPITNILLYSAQILGLGTKICMLERG